MKKIFTDVKKLKEFMAKNKDCKVLITNGHYEVTSKDVVEIIDADSNDHVTQDEVVEYVHKIAPNKSRKEIISDIDTNENGRITKGEVKDWVEKQEK